MDVEEIRKLVRLMEEAGITELEIENRSGKVRLVRGTTAKRSRDVDVERTTSDRTPGASNGGADEDEQSIPNDVTGRVASAVAAGSAVVTSPMVGTFFRASGPDAEPFVATGDVVHPGQVLCIIEAMKMMNEIHAEVAGRIVGITAENGSPVEYGSPLFVIAPLE